MDQIIPPPGRAHLPRFLTELHGFFEACPPDVDAALASYFLGEDTTVDWILATLELFVEDLTGQPFTTSTEPSGDST
ncbi:hypothetical protein ACFWIB_39130 [Streptomyces sp. NPDC127051]|uniref:hypothetical protein n=1 Tax=Streptomyces sp. NPDC127051 TaxID=3347119 RepID=UPI00365C18BC